ncbi:DNA-binding CsgD family transcriptional regulator [Nakamurella sp. UYEF19]
MTDFFGSDESPGSMTITGEAGIGKSTLWAAGVSLAMARSMLVLSVRPTQAEARMSFAGLGDLFESVADDVLPQLHHLQRTALEVALLRRVSHGPPPSEREIGAAVLKALRFLSGDRSITIAADDVQWLDQATADVLGYALRRLRDEPVWVLITRRTGDPDVLPDIDAPGLVESNGLAGRHHQVVALGALPAPALGELLCHRLGSRWTPGTLREMVTVSGGNPYWAIELGQARLSLRTGEPRAEERLTVPDTLTGLLDRRLRRETGAVREVVLVVAALSTPTCRSAGRALAGVMADPETAIDDAVAAGLVVETAGRLRMSHPLLGSQALRSLPPGQRRRLHRRLADNTADPEQRARHLALATDGEPDADLARSLEAGALSARSRGAVHTAAELADLAIASTPAGDRIDRFRRGLTAAELYFAAGDLQGACERAGDLAADRPDADGWSDLLPMLVETTYWVHGQRAAQAAVRTVLDGFPTHPRCRAVALACAADVGDGAGSDRADLARESIRLFDGLDGSDPGSLSMALVYLAEDHLDSGHGMATDLLKRAEAAESRHRATKPRSISVLNRVSSIRAYQLKLVDDLDGARTSLNRAITTARAEGDDGSIAALLGHLALTEYWAGHYRRSTELSSDGLAQIEARGGVAPATLYSAYALSAVLSGQAGRARELIMAQLPGDDADPTKKTIAYCHVLGLADLLDGHPAAALVHLERAWRAVVVLKIQEPGRRQRLEADLGEALIAAGQLERAAELATEQLALGALLSRTTLIGVGHRLRGLIHAANGELDDAVASLGAAVAAHQLSPLALELPRSLFALGQVHRRRRDKPGARSNLRAAKDRFTTIEAIPWMRFADDELARIDGPRTGAMLTATEEKVAALAGAGRNNREIAAELFISSRTVEGHLAVVYRKLAIRGRAQLAHRNS